MGGVYLAFSVGAGLAPPNREGLKTPEHEKSVETDSQKQPT
jgi:hypothetical protein